MSDPFQKAPDPISGGSTTGASPRRRQWWPPVATLLVFALVGPLVGYIQASAIAAVAQSPDLVAAIGYFGNMMLVLPLGAMFSYLFGLVPAAVAGLAAVIAVRWFADHRVALAATLALAALAAEMFPYLILHGPRGGDPIANSFSLIGAISAAVCWRLTARWR